MFRFLVHLSALLWVSFLAAAVVQSHRVPNWATELVSSPPPRSPAPALIERIEQGLYKRNAPVIITEAELNDYLKKQLRISSNGPLAESLAFENFYVQCQAQGFEVRYVWKTANGHLSAASARFQVARQDNLFLIEPVAGSYGHLSVPRGFLAPLLPALTGLAQALKPELDLAFQMNQLRFEPGRIILDPQLQQQPF